MPAGLLLCQETHDLSTPPEEPCVFHTDVYCTHMHIHTVPNTGLTMITGFWIAHDAHCKISNRYQISKTALQHLTKSKCPSSKCVCVVQVHCISSDVDVISRSWFCPSCLHNNFLWLVRFCWWIAWSCALASWFLLFSTTLTLYLSKYIQMTCYIVFCMLIVPSGFVIYISVNFLVNHH